MRAPTDLETEKKLFQEADSRPKKPTLFLHACCGPCLTYPLVLLLSHFEVTVGFFNPNIQPVEEYERRLETLKGFLLSYGEKTGVKVPLVVNEEDFGRYSSLFKDRATDREGGKVCLRCHAYRMALAYDYAEKHGFDYFTTVMTVSSKKPSREINEIGRALEKSHPRTRYLVSDFKKEDGQWKGIQMARAYGLYRQEYCGCLYSLREREEIKKRKAARRPSSSPAQ